MSAMEGMPALPARRTASDEIAGALRDAIIAGRFADGEELNQVELAEHFGVSRVPIREALRRLQAEGLVSAEAHRQATVLGLNTERIEEIYEIRALLEGWMLRKAAPALDADRMAALRGLCDDMDRIEDNGAWLERNHAFHQALLEPAGAPSALAMVDQLTSQVERYVRRTGGVDRPREVNEEHRAILEALARRSPAKAAEGLRRHILGTSARVRAALAADAG